MSVENFNKAFNKTLSWEITGGEDMDFLDDPQVQAGDISTAALRRKTGYTDGVSGASEDDKGGETKFGVAQNAHPNINVRKLTLSQARTIYKRGYWDACKCSQLPDDVARYVFDIAVNSGPGRAIKMLQQACGTTIDGFIGPKTIAAAKAIDQKKLVESLRIIRIVFYEGLARRDVSQRRFIGGWLRRAKDSF